MNLHDHALAQRKKLLNQKIKKARRARLMRIFKKFLFDVNQAAWEMKVRIWRMRMIRKLERQIINSAGGSTWTYDPVLARWFRAKGFKVEATPITQPPNFWISINNEVENNVEN